MSDKPMWKNDKEKDGGGDGGQGRGSRTVEWELPVAITAYIWSKTQEDIDDDHKTQLRWLKENRQVLRKIFLAIQDA